MWFLGGVGWGGAPSHPSHPTAPKTTPELEIMKFRSFLYVHSRRNSLKSSVLESMKFRSFIQVLHRRNSLEVFRIGNYEIPKFHLSSLTQEFARSLQSWKLGNSEVFFKFNPSWVPEKVNLRRLRNVLISNSEVFQRIPAIVNWRKTSEFS